MPSVLLFRSSLLGICVQRGAFTLKSIRIPLMNTTPSVTPLKRKVGSSLFAILSCAASFCLPTGAHAQTTDNADAVYNGWTGAYLQTTAVNGYTYPLPYITQSISNRDRAFMWQQAYMISAIEDAYDASISNTRKNLIVSLINSFEKQDLVDLTWDDWNDDLEWAIIMLAHGYQITGTTSYLNAATQNWNSVYNRGWSSDLGGGIWEKDTGTSKVVLSNAPFIIGGCMLYRATGDSTYLTKCQQVYTWMRANCFNTSTGGLIEGKDASGAVLGSNNPGNSYNSGIFLQAADALYQVTGTASYLSDAQLCANHIVNANSILTEDHPNNGPFGSEEFFRGLSYFARIHNLWGTYYPWLQANAQAAWNHRRTDYSITANNFNAATTTGDILAMETVSSLIVQQVTAIRPDGQSELKNAASALSLNVSGGSTANGAAIVQWPYGGGTNSLFTFTQHSDSGYCEMVSVSSGKDVAVQNASTTNGAPIIQNTFGSAGNDLWVPALTIDGNYSFVNRKSGKTLEDPGASTAQGTQMDQWDYNRGSNQRWQFIRH